MGKKSKAKARPKKEWQTLDLETVADPLRVYDWRPWYPLPDLLAMPDGGHVNFPPIVKETEEEKTRKEMVKKTEVATEREMDKTPWTAPWAKKVEERKKETGYEQQLLPVPRQRTYSTSFRGIIVRHTPRRDEYLIKQNGQVFLKDSKGCETYQWQDWWGTIDRIEERNRKIETGEIQNNEDEDNDDDDDDDVVIKP
jgi:hypothetical protein